MDNRKIGVFDSGLGGLTVVREMQKLMPEESVVYFGDIARLPYGSKSKETITEFSHQIMRFLLKHDVKAMIIACGTASANALEDLQETYD
ncbi:MAG: aspartate/glutamate racemase family protein, partial [Firmicutes bacterium]|nr:aspartate/glutamate racemase family protein [Bacillota bacterium]